VLAIKVVGHKGSSAALLVGALTAQTSDLAALVDLVVLQHGEFDLLLLVGNLLGLGVDLLFALLATTAKAEDKMKGALLLDVVIRESASILKLLASENEALLIGGNSLLILNLLLHIVNGVRGLDFEGDGLPR